MQGWRGNAIRLRRPRGHGRRDADLLRVVDCAGAVLPAAVLPASLSLEFRRQFLNNKFVANLYIQKYISRYSKFQVAAGLNYNIWNGFQVGVTGGLSSHGNWYAGIQMHVFRKDNFQLKITAPSLINVFQGERNFVAIGQVLLSKAF